MKKLINFISKSHNYKLIIGFLFGLIVAGTSVYAITVAGNTVTYDNTNSGLTSTNVQGAIDEVYTKANSCNISLKELGNSNIVSVKKYDQTTNSSTYCVTGNEATCQILAPTKTGTYAKGTIVDYKVNNNTTETFYIIHDDGNTLTMQTKKNIVNNVAYATKADFIAAGGTEAEYNSCVYTDGNGNKYYGCSTRGPVTILPALENVTSTWTNVNLQTYTPGTTSFAGNNKTGCTSSACSENTYTTMGERSARARLITVPEAWATGCKTWQDKTCPKYMYNYLKNANNYEGIVDGNETSYAYWTMNARSDTASLAWVVDYVGNVSNVLVFNASYGARPVVVVNK